MRNSLFCESYGFLLYGNDLAYFLDSEVSVDTDDDDDDDLTPIDTCDVPNKSRIVYIRDFLEQLPELKTYDETKAAFSALPPVIRHQLQLEHPQLGRDLLDVVFRWENSYDSPGMSFLLKLSMFK